MKALIIVNVSAEKEFDEVENLANRFENLRIITSKNIQFGNVWKVSDSDKTTVEWTRRFMKMFLDTDGEYDTLIKIDPDTVIRTLPDMPLNCDVAGDFRKLGSEWIWFGACQYYTKNAVKLIFEEPSFYGNCAYQDIELAKSIKKLELRCYNMEDVDGWSSPDSTALVTHRKKSHIDRLPSGFIIMN